MTTQILIIGGGIFGMAAALELRARGYAVRVLDQGSMPHPLAASTDISKVVRIEYGADEPYTALAESAREGWLRWNQMFGQDLYHEDGLLMLSRGAMTPGGFTHDSYHMLRQRGHRLERLDGPAIARRFPAWNAELYRDGYFNTKGGYAESGRVVAALVAEAQKEGVQIDGDHPVSALLREGGRVRGVQLSNGQEVTADEVIVAAGAWTPLLLPELQGVIRVVGQPVFHLKPQNPERFRTPYFYTFAAAVSETGWYGFPMHPHENVLKVANHGVGREVHPRNDVRVVTTEQIEMLRDFLSQTFPELVDAPLVYTRLCLYCDVLDGHFWIDRHPQWQGLTIASGGSGHGFKFGPVLGELIADALEGKDNPDLQRFRWRELDAATVNEEATRHKVKRQD